MKKASFRLCSVILAVACICSVSASASVRASDKIDYYTASVSRENDGVIAIAFHVESNKRMDRIGAESITVYEGRRIAGSYDREDTGMSLANSNRYKNTLYFDGVSGVEYRVVVTVFAEDASGCDSRTKEFTVTAK